MLLYVDTKHRPRRKPKPVAGPVAGKALKNNSGEVYRPRHNHLYQQNISKPQLPSADSLGSHTFVRRQESYADAELMRRELVAREKLSRLKYRLVIPFNKGGYVVATPGMDPTLFGRK